LTRGVIELTPPEEDRFLIEMKSKYAQKKTAEVNAG
jgi:hypothetical protein